MEVQGGTDKQGGGLGGDPDGLGMNFLRQMIGGNQQNINFKLDGAGTRIAMMCCIVQLVITVMAVPGLALILWVFSLRIDAVGERIDDMKLDIASEVRPDINALQGDVKAIRAYINTGRIPAPPKKDQDKDQK